CLRKQRYDKGLSWFTKLIVVHCCGDKLGQVANRANALCRGNSLSPDLFFVSKWYLGVTSVNVKVRQLLPFSVQTR
ncbi:MAG: hypothetical protein NZ739_05035, partial [Verrucomicrobiae bacterium]|nr:hypothetical protein [Verrucomicrobiae bacterium]